MSLRHALLGLLAHGAKSGYDLKREFDRSAAHAWNANSSQIYPTLRELERDGLIVPVPQPPASRRSEYALTKSGSDELQAWLRDPVEGRTRRDPFLLRVFFLDLLPPTDQYRQLVRFVEEQERFLELCTTYRATANALDEPLRWRLTSMEVAAAGADAQRSWVELRILELAHEHPEVAALEGARRALRGDDGG